MKSRSTSHTPGEVQALLAELEQSGLPVSQFAKKKRMPPTTIYNWLRKKHVNKDCRAFLPAVIQPEKVDSHCDSILRLHLGQGRILEMPSSVSPQWLGEVLRGIG